MNTRRAAAFLTAMALATLTASAAMAADGAAIYKAKCASCHAADGSGQTPMGKSMKVRDLRSAEVQKQSDAELRKITADGKAKMPAYKGKLSEAELTAVVAHMRTMKQ